MHAEGHRGIAVGLEADGIIEVTRVRRVDGDDGLAGQVLALAECAVAVGGLEAGQGGAGVVQRGWGKLIGKSVGTNDRERLDLSRAGDAQAFNDDADRQFARAWVLDDLDDDLVAHFWPGLADVPHDDRRYQCLAVRQNEPRTVGLRKRADEPALAAADDLDDLAAEDHLPAPLAGRGCAGDDRVAVHGAASAFRGDEQVAVAVGLVGHDETEALGVRPVRAYNAGAHWRKRQRVLRPDDDPSGVPQPLDGLAERAVLLVLDAHLPGKLPFLERLILPPGQELHYGVNVLFRH